MWSQFFLLSVCLSVFLIAPGFLLAYGVTKNHWLSLLASPLLTVFLLSLFSILNGSLGIFTDLTVIGLEAASASLVTFAIGYVIGRKQEFASELCLLSNFKIVLLALAFSFSVAIFYYVLPLDGPSSFAQDSDNSFHLSLIRSFAESGNWSSLTASVYSGMGANQIASIGGGFYPAAWHDLAVLIFSIANSDPCLAANVVNFVILCIVFPLSNLLLLTVLFPEKPCLQVCGIIVSLAFSSFPWGTLLSVSGPLFPNTLGFSFVPACLGLLLMMMKTLAPFRFRAGASISLLVVCGLFALVLSHPNSVFTLAIFLISLLLIEGFSISRRFGDKAKRFVFCGSLILLLVFVWILLYESPFLYGVTHFRWPSTASFSQAVVNCLSLSFRMPACSFVLSLLMLLGVLYSIKERKYFWLSCSFAMSCVIYIVGVSSSGFVKGLFSGFWYTDPYRLGASASVVCMPVATLGAYAFVRLMRKVCQKLGFERGSSRVVIGMFSALAVFFAYVGNYSLPGLSNVTTGFGDYKWCATMSNSYDRPNLFDEQEKSFCLKAADIVGKDLVYNNADDGSVFAYPLYDINLVYKRSLGDRRKNINSDEQVLCEKLNEINENPEVKEILYRSGVKYILNLDYGGEPLYDRCYYGSYDPDNWRGMNALKDDNPSLKVVLSEGDCRLYEILY